MIVDFMRGEGGKLTLDIEEKPAENVEEFKFISTKISANLKWDRNLYNILKLAHQRLLLKLKKREVMVLFYTSAVFSLVVRLLLKQMH